MTCVISIDGEIVQKLISCHQDTDTFSYFVNGRWVNGRTVPRDILYAPEIPESERRYVLSVMATLGRMPS